MGMGIADDAECSGWFYTFQERADGSSRWDIFIIPNIPIEQSFKHLGQRKGHHCWNEFKCIITCFPYTIMYIMIVSNSPKQQAVQMLSPAFAILYFFTLNQYILIGKHTHTTTTQDYTFSASIKGQPHRQLVYVRLCDNTFHPLSHLIH